MPTRVRSTLLSTQLLAIAVLLFGLIMTTIKLVSAGVILYRINKDMKREYLIIRHRGGHWDMPKGKLEPGETIRQAALRELAEETGITEVTIDPDFQASCSYDIRDSSDNQVHKEVFFFLGHAEDNQPVVLSEEHTEYVWATVEQCDKQLTYIKTQQIIAAADTYLQQ